MQEYWQKVHERALARMAAVIGEEVADDPSAVTLALAFAMKNKSCMDAAKMICAVDDWKWARHEIEAHRPGA